MENKNMIVEETTEKKKKEPMTTKQKVMLGLRIAFNVVFYALIIFLFLFSLMNIRGGNGTENFPNIFGKGFLSVQSDSMERDETKKDSWPKAWETYKIGEINTGDLINDDVFNKNNADKLQVGDVITFVGIVNGKNALITHRIVNIRKDANGEYVFTTQGDKIAQTAPYNPNASETEKYIQQSSGIFEEISVNSIRGVVTSVNSGAGKVLDTIQKNWLFIFIIPIVVLLIIEIFLVIRNIMLLRGEKNKLELADTKEAMLAEVEAEKEKMRQELLAELRAQGLAPAEDTKPQPEPEPEAVEEPTVEEVPSEEEKTVLVADAAVVEDKEEPKEEETPEVVEEQPKEVEATEEVKEEAEVEAVEEKVEEPVVEETPAEEAPATEEAPAEEPQAEEAATEEAVETPEVVEEVKEEQSDALEIKVDETEEPKEEAPKKAAPKKSSTTAAKKTSTTKKSTTTAKKATTTKKESTTAKKSTTTKKTTKKTEK